MVVAITVRMRARGIRHMCYSCMCDHLRPLGFLSADDLLVVGHDLEEISFFVDHSELLISIHKHEAK